MFRKISLLLITMLILAGCGLIPPIEIGNDPFGLSGQVVTTTVQPESALATEATATTPSPVSVQFDNIDLGRAPRPSQILADLSIHNNLTVSIPGAVTVEQYPATITLTSVTFEATLSEPGSSSAEVGGTLTGSVVFTRGECGVISCQYSATDAALDDVTLTLSGPAMAIIFGGSEPNTVTVSVSLELDSNPELPVGTTISVTLQGGKAVARL
jgi:hypothetical protein